MTVDDRLRTAHARIPAPDDATVARARARLETAMAEAEGAAPSVADGAASREPAYEAPHRFGHAAPPVAADAASRWTAHDAPPVSGHAARGARPRRRRRTWLRLALPIVALGVAGAAAIALIPTRVETPVTPSLASAARACASVGAPEHCLRALGSVAAGQPALAPGEVFYQRNTFRLGTMYIGADGRPGANPDDAAFVIANSVPEELWLAADGSGRLAYGDESAAYLPGVADERAWRAAGSPDLDALMGPPAEWGPKIRDFGPGELDEALIFNSNLEAVLPKRDPLSVLPHEPRELAEFLREAAEKQREGSSQSDIDNTFGTNVTTFLRYPRTPPDLRAALLEVFATVPGARSLGTVTDPAGRTAAAIELPPDISGGANIVAFDPKTSRLMAEGASDGAGGIRWGTTYAVESAGVAKIGERP